MGGELPLTCCVSLGKLLPLWALPRRLHKDQDCLQVGLGGWAVPKEQ